MTTQLKRLLLLGISTVSMLAPAGALQAQPAQPKPQNGDSANLQDIIVTAQRTETTLQRTPIAVTAVSGADLKTRGVTNLLDLQSFTPGLQVGSRAVQGSQQGGFSIRGMGIDATAQSPAVGIYVDDVYYPSAAGNLLGLADVQRVEVLRGPQGTLFGRNTIAGAIQYISVQPGHEFAGFVEGTVGNFGRKDISAAVTIPLDQTLSTRFSFQRTYRGGFVHDDLNNIERGQDKVIQGSAKLRWTPTAGLTVDLKGDYIRQRNNGRALAVTGIDPTGQLVQVATNPFALGPFAYTGPFDNRFVSTKKYHIAGFNGDDSFRYKYWAAQGTIRYDISDALTLKSVTAYNKSVQHSKLDFDATPAPIIQGIGGNPETIKLFTQEVQLSGHAFANRLKWTAGVYYYDSTDLDEGRGFVLGMLPPAIGFQPSNGDNLIKTVAKAVYAQGTYSFTDQLSVVLGLRYSQEKVEGTNRTFPRPPLSNKFNNLSPLVGVNFQASSDLLFYAKASRGFRAGGFAVSNALAAGFVSFKPETAWTYEAGSRMEFFNRRVRINPTIYYTDWKDIQFQSLLIGQTPDGTTTTVVAAANAGDARLWGAELEAQFAATDRLSLIASAATINGEYTRISPGVSVTKDSDLQRAPRFKYSIGAQYTYPLANEASVVANMNWSHTSSQRSSTTDDAAITLPPYGLLNARVQLNLDGGKFSLAVFATNLINKYYYIGGVGRQLSTVVGASEADLARPREYGLTARVAL